MYFSLVSILSITVACHTVLPVTVLIPSDSRILFNPIAAVPLQKKPVYSPHQFRLFRYYHQISVLILRISKELIVVDNNLSYFKPSHNSPVTVFADIPAFLLCLAAQDRNQQFPASLQSVNPLFFKKYSNVLFFLASGYLSGSLRYFWQNG